MTNRTAALPPFPATEPAVCGCTSDSTTMLIPDIWQEVAAKVPGEVIVAVPASDSLIVTSSESSEGLAQVLQLSEQVREYAGQHALSQFLYAWRDERWQLFGQLEECSS